MHSCKQEIRPFCELATTLKEWWLARLPKILCACAPKSPIVTPSAEVPIPYHVVARSQGFITDVELAASGEPCAFAKHFGKTCSVHRGGGPGGRVQRPRSRTSERLILDAGTPAPGQYPSVRHGCRGFGMRPGLQGSDVAGTARRYPRDPCQSLWYPAAHAAPAPLPGHARACIRRATMGVTGALVEATVRGMRWLTFRSSGAVVPPEVRAASGWNALVQWKCTEGATSSSSMSS